MEITVSYDELQLVRKLTSYYIKGLHEGSVIPIGSVQKEIEAAEKFLKMIGDCLLHYNQSR